MWLESLALSSGMSSSSFQSAQRALSCRWEKTSIELVEPKNSHG